MNIGEFNFSGLHIVDRTRGVDNGDSYVCLRKTGLYIGQQAAKELELEDKKYMAFVSDNIDPAKASRLYLVPNNQENFENNSKISDGVRTKKHKRVKSNSFAKSVSAQDVIKNFRRLGKLLSESDRKKRRFKLYKDEDRNGHFLELRPTCELTALDHSHLPEESGIYRLIDSHNDTCYIGQATNLKSRVSTHKNEGLGFNKIEYSLISEKDDRDKWESHFIDDYLNERGRLPFYNKQNGNNHGKYLTLTSVTEEVINGTNG